MIRVSRIKTAARNCEKLPLENLSEGERAFSFWFAPNKLPFHVPVLCLQVDSSVRPDR